jgi:hypothetical protein
MEQKLAACIRKVLCFGSTALIASVSSYDAELTHAIAGEQLKMVFVGVPNQLTVPPGFPSALVNSLEDHSPCGPAADMNPKEERAAYGPDHVDGTCSPDALKTDARPSRLGQKVEAGRQGSSQESQAVITTRGP